MEFHTKSKLHHFALGEYLQREAVNVWAQCKVPVLIKPKPSWELLCARTFLKQDYHSRGFWRWPRQIGFQREC